MPTDEVTAYQTESPAPAEPPMYTRIRAAGVYRDRDRAWFAGVCAGLARALGVDPLLVRALFVLLMFFGGVAVPVYLIAWLVMPDTGGVIPLQQAVNHGHVGYLLLIAAAIVSAVISLSVLIDRSWTLVGLAIVAILLWILSRSSKRQATDIQPPVGPSLATNGPPSVAQDPQRVGASAPPWPQPAPNQELGDTMTTPHPPGYDPRYSTYDPAQRYGYSSAPAHTLTAPPTADPPTAGPGVGGAGAGAPVEAPSPLPAWTPAPAWPPGPPPGPVRRRPSGYVALLSIGVACLGLAAGILMHPRMGLPGTPVTFGLLIALVLVSLIVLALSLTGRGAGASALLVFALGTTASGTALFDALRVGDGVGDVSWVATPADGNPHSYALGLGNADLAIMGPPSGSPAPKDPMPVDVTVNVGELIVSVPRGYAVQVDADVSLGNIMVQGGDGATTTFAGSNDTNSSITRTFGKGTTLAVVDAHVNVGNITIVEE